MTPLRAELRHMRVPLLWLACSCALSIVLTWAGSHYGGQAAAAARTAEQQATSMRSEAERLRREENDLRTRIGEYLTLRQRGLIGPERRLDWVELMRNIESERRLLGLEYEIYPQLPLSPAVLRADLPDHVLLSSNMHLVMPLLHEEDLLRFIGDLQARAPALIRLRSCKLRRGTTAHAEDYALPPQVHADCMLEWITLQDKRDGGSRP